MIDEPLRPFPAEKVDLADFLPITQLDIEQMWAELLEILRDIKDARLACCSRNSATKGWWPRSIPLVALP